MFNPRPKTWAGRVFALTFMFGELVAGSALMEGSYAAPTIFIALWPGIMFAATVIIYGSSTAEEVKDITGKAAVFVMSRAKTLPRKAALAFICGEVEFVAFVLSAWTCTILVILWPITLALLVLGFFYLSSRGTWLPAPDPPDQLQIEIVTELARRRPQVRHREMDPEDENYERRFHFAMALQERLQNR
jgi:hypothetical protein